VVASQFGHFSIFLFYPSLFATPRFENHFSKPPDKYKNLEYPKPRLTPFPFPRKILSRRKISACKALGTQIG
jgi:hypothetical protein